MTQDELIHLLSAHEWKDLEFKEARSAVPKNAYETVSAFANTAGGCLVFGIRKEGARFEAVGVLNVDEMQNAFLSTLRQRDKISIMINIKEELKNIDGKDILLFHVPEANRTEKPVHLNGDLRRAFIRKGGIDVRCCEEEIRRLVMDASTDRYDGQTVNFNLDSCFDSASISWYRNVYDRRSENRSYAGKNDIEFLFELGLVKETLHGLKASRAAILLFGRDGSFRDILPRPVVDCQRFGSIFGEYTQGTRWDDRIVLDCNLIRSWQSLLDWHQKLVTTPFQVDPATMQRVEMPADYIVFRETVINLLIHQDYTDHSRKPEIRHFADRTIFWNPGDAFASLDNLLEPGQKMLRNPSIVTAFRKIGLSEHAGWGLREVFTSWQQLGNVPPLIHNDKSSKAFELTLPKELLLSEEQIIFQAQLGLHLESDAARLFAYICKEKTITVTDAKAVLAHSTAKSLTILQYLMDQVLIAEIEGGKQYTLADRLLAKFPSDQPTDQVTDQPTDQAGTDLVTQPMDQPSSSLHQAMNPSKLALSEYHKKVLRLCETPQSSRNLMAELGMGHRPFFRKTVLKPLLIGNLIQPIHPDQPNHPKQAYALTEAGLRLLERIKT